MKMDIEAFCVHMEEEGVFRGSGNFNEKRTEFWEWMQVRVVGDLLRINHFDIEQFAEFDGPAKAACKAYISFIKANAPERASNVQEDHTAAARRAPAAGGASSSSSAAQSEVEKLRAQLRREKRKTEGLKADKKRLGEIVGEIQKGWQAFEKKLRVFAHPERHDAAREKTKGDMFKDVDHFDEYLQKVLPPVHDADGV